MVEVAERITVDPRQCGGRACVRGMRIRVSDVLDLLASGLTPEQVLGELPDLARIIHEASAATSQLPASAGLPSLRGLNDLFKVVSGALGRESLHLQAFATFRSNPHE